MQTGWVVLATGALLLSACGGSDSTAASSETDDDGSASETQIIYESPLGEFLGWDQGADFDEEAAQAEWEEQDRQVQEAIAACMSEQGFEYIPIDTAAQNAFFEEQFEDGEEWGSEEWTAKYGFGISTQRFSQEQVGPDLVGHNYVTSFGSGDGPEDPNQAYVESLGPNEQNAYYEALYGGEESYPVPIWEEEGREPTEEEMQAFDQEWQENYVPTGCEPVAYEEIYNVGPGGEEQYMAFDEEFGEALQAMEARMESHPEVIAYREEVQACVEERGLEFLTEEDAWQYFEQEMTAAGLGWDAMSDPLEGVDTSDFSDEDFERAYIEAESQPLPADMLTALAEVQASEIATATALFDCGGGWQNEFEALQSVRVGLEEEFLEENADRLAEYEGVFGS